MRRRNWMQNPKTFGRGLNRTERQDGGKGSVEETLAGDRAAETGDAVIAVHLAVEFVVVCEFLVCAACSQPSCVHVSMH